MGRGRQLPAPASDSEARRRPTRNRRPAARHALRRVNQVRHRREMLDGAYRGGSVARPRNWRARRESVSEIRASWMPAALPAVLALVDGSRVRRVRGHRLLRAAPAVGAGVIHIAGDPASSRGGHRAAPRSAGYDRARRRRARRDATLKDRADVWGPRLPSAVVAGALKRALDPAGILNASRGPV